MVMRVMLIGLLVIGAVAMLETDVSAHPPWLVPACFSVEESRCVWHSRRAKPIWPSWLTQAR